MFYSGNMFMLSEISGIIKKHQAKRVLIQIPEGMKTKAQEISEIAEKRGVETIILAEPCFGACDVPDNVAEQLECDLIIQFGHSSMGLKSKVPIEYVEYRLKSNALKILEEHSEKLKDYKKIGLLTTLQHIDELKGVKKVLERDGKIVFIGKPDVAKYAGQILGCDQQAAKIVEGKVDAFLYIGSGRFHSLGVAHKVNKPVLILDVEKNDIFELKDELEKYQKKLIMKKEKFKDAKNIGLLVSTKKGQLNKDVFDIKRRIEKQNKKVWIVAMDQITPEKILGMNFDVLINTACPRIEEDLVFGKPVLNWFDIVQSGSA